MASRRTSRRIQAGIIADACRMMARGWIQLGLLLLIATPVARVIFSVFAFYLEAATIPTSW